MSNMKSSWEKVKLGDISKIGRGSSPRPINDKRYFEKGNIPWIKIADATKSGKYLYKTKQKVNEYGASFSKKFPKGSLILAASGTLGYVQILGIEGCIHDGWMYLEAKGEIDVDFLYYYLKNHEKYFFSKAYGVAIQNINTSILKDTTIFIPDLLEQRKIGSILSLYDDLIENNNRRIKILEEMAQLIYKEWFVKFRFPGHKKVKMIDSDFGKIPEGWKVRKLGNIIEFYKGRKARDIFDEPKENTKQYLLVEGLRNKHSLYTDDKNGIIVNEKEIIMIMDGASSGHVFIGFEGFLGSTLAVIRMNKKHNVSSFLIFFYLKENRKSITDNNVGSAIPHANKDYIKNMLFELPPSNLNKKFDDIFSSVFKEIQNLYNKNKKLKETRDLLLPKMINGEIDIK